MRVLPFKLAPLVLAVLAPFAQAQIITVGPNINVSKLAGNQSETAIAINRLNTNNITIGSNNISGPLLFNKYTNDGGSTWTDSTFRPNGGYDPWMGADAFGALYYSYETVASGRATFIARSIDGGATYTTTQIPGTNADHPEMSIGPGAAPGTQSLYLRDSQGNNNRVISGTLTAGGAGPYAVQSPVGTGNFGSTAVGPGGRTIMTSMNPAGSVGPATMTLRYDADGTGPGGYVVQSSIVTNVGGFRPVPAQPSRTIDAQVELEYDFSGGANNGSLYMLYTQAANTTTNNTDIVFRKSTDNGLTFSPEIKLNTDAGTNSQFFAAWLWTRRPAGWRRCGTTRATRPPTTRSSCGNGQHRRWHHLGAQLQDQQRHDQLPVSHHWR